MTSADHATFAARFPGRADRWVLRRTTLELPARPLVMGIVNVTPDSFSDGAQFFDSSAAVDHALRLRDEGADILDIGGESTRPYAEPVEVAEELRRVIPVIEAVCGRSRVPVSIDTSKAVVAREALAAGAEIINDVTALVGDPLMTQVASESQTGVCAMHMQGTPRTMQDDPRYDDVVGEILSYLQACRERLVASGLHAERIALDAGIGFGKTHAHNLTLLARMHCFHKLQSPLVVGHSRKGFIGKVLGNADADRMAGTIGVALSLARQGVQVIRVHDVAPVRQALQLFEATGGLDVL